MTMVISGDNGLTFPNSTIQASAGSVLQVVSSTIATVYSTTSTSFVASGMSASITPKFSTSKILVLATIGVGQATNGSSAGGAIALYRNSTALQSPQTYQNFINTAASANPRLLASINYLDSPSTTSSVAYNIYFASYSGANAWQLNEASNGSTITLLEIAG